LRVDLERSLFKTNLLNNKVLLWSTALQALASFAVIYIPAIVSYWKSAFCVTVILYTSPQNDRVFLHDGIGWEWGLVFGQVLNYWVCAELWKLAKRRRLRKKGYVVAEEEEREKDEIDEIIEETEGKKKKKKATKMPDRRLRLEDTIPPPRGMLR
jgi:type VI protein secretion system component VasK